MMHGQKNVKLMGSVASPMKVTTEFWQYLRSVLPRISGISITPYQTNVTVDARWSHLNKETVILCSINFTDLAKWITNNTLAFEWGDKTLYWMNKQSTWMFSIFSDRVRSKFVSFLTLKEKIRISNVLLQSHIRSRDGSVGIVTRIRNEVSKNRCSFARLAQKFVFSEVFSPSLGTAQPPKGMGNPFPGIRVSGCSLDWKNNRKVAIFRPTQRSLLPRRPGWTDNFLNFFLLACKS